MDRSSGSEAGPAIEPSGGLDIDPNLIMLRDRIAVIQNKLAIRNDHKAQKKSGRRKRPLAVGHGNGPTTKPTLSVFHGGAENSLRGSSKQADSSSLSATPFSASFATGSGPAKRSHDKPRSKSHAKKEGARKAVVDSVPSVSPLSSRKLDTREAPRSDGDVAAAGRPRAAVKTEPMDTEESPLVLESVQRQEAALKITRKRRRKAGVDAAVDISFDPETLEAVLVAERNETMRVTRSQKSTQSPDAADIRRASRQSAEASEKDPQAPSLHKTTESDIAVLPKQPSSESQTSLASTPRSRRKRRSVSITPASHKQRLAPAAAGEVVPETPPHTAMVLEGDPSVSVSPDTPSLPPTVSPDVRSLSRTAHVHRPEVPESIDAVGALPASLESPALRSSSGLTSWPCLDNKASAISVKASFWADLAITRLAVHSDGSDVFVGAASATAVSLHLKRSDGTEWEVFPIISAESGSKVVTMDFVPPGVLVVGGHFAEDPDVVCRAYSIQTHHADPVALQQVLRLEAAGSIFCSTHIGPTLFTSNFSDGGMVVNVALWTVDAEYVPAGDPLDHPKEPLALLPPYHSGSPLVSLCAARCASGEFSRVLIGANWLRAVLWDHRSHVLLASIALDLGDAISSPPPIECIDALYVEGGDSLALVVSVLLRRQADSSDDCESDNTPSCPRILLEWQDSDVAKTEACSSMILDDVDTPASNGRDGPATSREITCAAAFGRYYALGDSEGRMVISDQFHGDGNDRAATPVAVVGPIELDDATHPPVGAIAVNSLRQELCVSFGRVVYLLGPSA
eukprot:m.157818 g.157818  ORF g.157818 m.157818 type:complete len:798 (-) comp14483_c0_seq2:1570-3963(-)